MKNKFIFVNGDIYLPSPRAKRAQALVVEDGVITDIGANVDIRHLWRRGYRKYDLKKMFVLPAFTDAHLHLMAVGISSKKLDLDGLDSLDKIISKIRKAAAGLKPGQWLLGRGWNKNLWGDDFPDKNILDKITDHPVALDSKDWHLLWVNSATLKYCHIDRNTPDPHGGVIEKDDKGEPTGILKEKASRLVYDLIPPLTLEQKTESILAAQRKLLGLGVVGVGDFDTWAELNTNVRELENNNRLKLRICKMIYPDNLDDAIRARLTTGNGSGHFRSGYLKLFSDGALGSQTALMFKPYKGSRDNYGVETLTQNELENFIKKAVKAGISVAIHAIGDRANSQTLGAFGNHLESFSKAGLTPRIEHVQILRKGEIKLFGKWGITASVQPIHATSDRDVADRYWGSRARYAYAFRSLLESGAMLAFGSDAPIESPDPIAGIHAAVTRKRSYDRTAWYPGEKISVSKAIEAYTVNSAKACCLDDISGDLKIGKRADFVILSDDIVSMKPSDIYSARTVATVVDGEFVYGKRDFAGR